MTPPATMTEPYANWSSLRAKQEKIKQNWKKSQQH